MGRIPPSLALVLVLAVAAASPAAAAPTADPIAAGRRWVGLTTGVHHEHVENVSSVLQDVTLGDASSWNIDLAYGKFVRPGAMLGGGIAYDHASANVTSPQTLGPPKTVDEKTSTLTGSVTLRNYLPLGSPHFYLYNQVGLSGGATWGKQTTTAASTVESDISGQRYALELKPGVAVMVDKGFAVELGVNVLGLVYENQRVKTPGLPDAYRSTTDLNFELSLLKLGLGFTYYF
jgi:opacity protein-like surface antigen